MPIRTAKAVWEGNLSRGTGVIEFGNWRGAYSAGSRFENEKGTNPEELIGAAHAGCFSMALSGILGKAGITPKRLETKARVHIDKVGDGYKITKIELHLDADVPGIDLAKLREHAEAAKKGCPVSQALAGTEIVLESKLVTIPS